MLDPDRSRSDQDLLDDESDDASTLLDVHGLGRDLEALQEIVDAVRDLQQRLFVDLLDIQRALFGLQSRLPLSQILQPRA